MPQCEKILDNGQQCSNQALPGRKVCQAHSRLVFTPVSTAAGEKQTSQPPPVPPPQPPPPAVAPTGRPTLRAVPLAAGKEPAFPASRLDERKILVAPRGLVWLDPGDAETEAARFDRVVRLLSLLSQEMELPGLVRLAQHRQQGDQLVFLTPPDAAAPNLSAFYDMAAAAVQLAGGRLLVGGDRAFVQYRDDRAPRGYDVADFQPPTNAKEVALVGPWGSRTFTLSEFTEKRLANLCLRVPPVPDRRGRESPLGRHSGGSGPPAEQVYVLAPPPLYPLLGRYFRAHRLHYSIARLHEGRIELILFEVAPRPGAATGKAVPPFVLDYLSRLPRVALLTLAHESGRRRVLVQWRYHYPLQVEHVAGFFEEDETVLLLAHGYSSLRVAPSPALFDGDRLMDLHTPRPDSLKVAPQAVETVPELKLPVVLRPDDGPTPPIAALLLSSRELSWLRRLMYRLPGHVFGSYSLCRGDRLTILMGGNRGVTGIPFGIALRRIADSPLFIPLRCRFVPDLPWQLLRQSLGLQDGVYTFLSEAHRIDVPATAFAPLSNVLIADPGQARLQVNLKSGSPLADLKWKAPPRPPVEVVRPGSPQAAAGAAGARAAGTGSGPISPGTLEEALRGAARTAEDAGDFLAAAMYYSLLNDSGSRARCFRQAASAPPPGPVTAEAP